MNDIYSCALFHLIFRCKIMNGSVVYTPLKQESVSGFGTIAVFVSNKDEKQQSITKRINILNPSV